MAGPDPRAPQALGDPGIVFAPPVSGSLTGLRVAVSPDLGGVLEVDTEVAAVVEGHERCSRPPAPLSTRRTPRSPRPTTPSAPCVRGTSRRCSGRCWPSTPTTSRQSLADNIRAGEHLTGADVARAYGQRTSLSERMREFFSDHDLLVLPTSQVPPFPADQEYPTEINGKAMETYLDWMRACYLITVTGCPAISVPFGRTPDGLPVGVQLVAPHGADRFLLEVAAALEEAVNVSADEEAARYVREGIPPFVEVYDRVRDLVRKAGLGPGDPLPGEVALAGELGFPRDLVKEALLLLEEDGKVVRQRDRRWRVAPPAEPAAFTDSFHRILGGRARPVRRLLVAIEDGSHWSHELLRAWTARS